MKLYQRVEKFGIDSLSDEEKHQFFVEFGKAAMSDPIKRFFNELIARKGKCIHCNKKFDQGIIRKEIKHIYPIDAYSWFTPEYLIHCQTTHGYAPDSITYFLEKTINTKQYHKEV